MDCKCNAEVMCMRHHWGETAFIRDQAYTMGLKDGNWRILQSILSWIGAVVVAMVVIGLIAGLIIIIVT